MNWVAQSEIVRIDSELTKLQQKKLDAIPANKPFIIAKIDWWLDQRLIAMGMQEN